MSSIEPKGFKPKGIRRANPSVRLADPELLEKYKTPFPKSQLEPSKQFFEGTRVSPIRQPQQERILLAAQKNPLIRPKAPSEIRLLSADIEKQIPVPQKPQRPQIQRPKIATPRVQPEQIPSERAYLPEELQTYTDAQSEIEHDDPYLTDTTIYTPQTRKSFYRFISDNYRKNFALPVQVATKIDEDACAKLGEAGKEKVEAFLYQKFVREYIRQASPYRGILVYHGLGSGKTCSAIAAAEALYGTSNKRIIVMTPFSLRANFMSEISFCGFRHFSLKNHWVAQPLNNNVLIEVFAMNILSLSDKFISRVKKYTEEGRRVIWIPDFTKPSNFDELSPQERDDIRAQINNSIENKIKFINYNGIQSRELKEYACNPIDEQGNRFFDNAVIVIDEVHNLTRLMQGSIMPYMIERKGKKRRIPAEPVTPGKWKPKMCGSNENYKRAFLFYRLLCDARNSKIIGLSGTPIINFPEELGILANILSGYIECVETSVLSTDPVKLNNFIKIINDEPRVDIVRKTDAQGRYNFLISVFPEGYEKVIETTGDKNEFIGIRHNSDAQDDIKAVYRRIKEKAAEANIPLRQDEVYVSYPRLPPDDETFRGNFISDSLDIKNEVVLKKRLTGLISYYKGSKEEYMPRVVRDEIIKCQMSDYMLSKYTTARTSEIEGEKGKTKEAGDAFADVELFSKMKNPSSYRFRSRAICNFAFPKGIERPFPDSPEEEEEEAPDVENLEMAEALTTPNEDEAMRNLVEEEEIGIIDPEIDELVEFSDVEGEEDEEEEEEGEQVGGVGEDEIKPLEQPKKKLTLKRPIKATPMPLPPQPESKIEEPGILDTISEGVEAVVDAIQEQTIKKTKSYQERIKEAMFKLNENREKFLLLNTNVKESRLDQYSSKLYQMLTRIQVSKGSNLVYSQFKTVEGLGVLGVALKANGYKEIIIEGSDLDPKFSAETEASLRKGPQSGERRFITFTGEGSRERRALTLNIFNGNFNKLPTSMRNILIESGYEKNKNNYGEICWVIGITGAGAEGISLKSCRSVHIMEPYWNNVRLDQVKGRAIRICSHSELPYKDREVEIYTYITRFSDDQLKGSKIDMTIRTTDLNDQTSQPETSDEKVYNVSVRKDKINQGILNIMKEVAVDCQLNAPDNGLISCFEVDGTIDQYMFDPELDTDIRNTTYELVSEKKAMTSIMQPQKAVDTETSLIKKEPKVSTVDVPVIEWKGARYILGEVPKSGGLEFYLYETTDLRMRNPVGKIGINPSGKTKFTKPEIYKV